MVPNRSTAVSTGSFGQMVSMLTQIFCQASKLRIKPLPGALAPGPGTWLPQAVPLQTGQALQYGPMQVRALSRISLYSMRVPPYIFFCIDRIVVQTPVPSNAGAVKRRDHVAGRGI